jgi:hypothetical protein
MAKRPLAITIIGWLFIAVGTVALTYHLLPHHSAEPKSHSAISHELAWILLIRLLAIVAGIFLLRGSNWARWLLVIWMTYHIALSAFHSVSEVLVHTILFSIIGYFLFRSESCAYFEGKTAAPQSSQTSH